MFLRVVLLFLGLGSFGTINRPGFGGLPSFAIVVAWLGDPLDRLDELIVAGRDVPDTN